MPSPLRRQLTLFVPPESAAAIEAVRALVDPVQHRLIAAHVTLCREDDIGALSDDEIARRFGRLSLSAITLQFSPPESFFGHGMLLRCVAGQDAFTHLRARILDTTAPREQAAHLTLAHPRNPRVAGQSLASAAALAALPPIEFCEVCLIAQTGSAAWQVRDRFLLHRG